jgi:hypothetical protein
MKAFLIMLGNESLRDAAIRSDTAEEAQRLAGADCRVGEIREDVAAAMGVPETLGIHEGIVTRWALARTNLFGEIHGQSRDNSTVIVCVKRFSMTITAPQSRVPPEVC